MTCSFFRKKVVKVTEKRWIGVGAVLLSATCFALTSILLKTAFNLGLSPLETLALQSWIASSLLLFYTLLFHREVFKVSKKKLVILAFQGIVGSLGTSVLYSYALLHLTVSVAILLLYLYPTLVLATQVIFRHKKVGRLELLALLLTLGGTVLASGVLAGVGEVPLIGIAFGLASAFAYAAFNVVGEVALQGLSPLEVMSFSQWFSSLGLILYFHGRWTQIPWQNSRIWLIGVALATIASIFPFYFILVGIQRIGSDQAAILSTFELPMTFLLAALFLQEFPGRNQWAGGALVLAGIILLNWQSRSTQVNSG
ncbi:MAG: DMT family transporter [Desulfitobacteriaceae bacterium]